jgi:hypothetical protein
MGQGTAEYIKRILRGETSYCEYVPHVTITRSYKNPPNLSDVTKWPPPGFLARFTGGEYPSGYPPPWTSAPAVYDADAAIYYSYLWSGPQLEFTGEVWQVEAQCQGFVQIDKDLYSDPFAPVS